MSSPLCRHCRHREVRHKRQHLPKWLHITLQAAGAAAVRFPPHARSWEGDYRQALQGGQVGGPPLLYSAVLCTHVHPTDWLLMWLARGPSGLAGHRSEARPAVQSLLSGSKRHLLQLLRGDSTCDCHCLYEPRHEPTVGSLRGVQASPEPCNGIGYSSGQAVC